MSYSYPEGFSAQTALNYADFCLQAYGQYYIYKGINQPSGQPYVFTVPQGYDMIYEVWGVDEIWNEDEATVPYGFVARKQGATDIVLTIRGTEGDIEWAEDLMEAYQMACPVANSQGLVHQGFASIYKSLTYVPASTNSSTPPAVGSGDTLSQVVSSAASAAVTGHSLGSSLATLLAMDVALNSKTPVSVIYTFASPKTGNTTFASEYNGLLPIQSYRVANVWDVVPHLPPDLFFTMDHEYHYEHVNSYCPVDGGVTIDVVTSHGLAAYEAGLKRLL